MKSTEGHLQVLPEQSLQMRAFQVGWDTCRLSVEFVKVLRAEYATTIWENTHTHTHTRKAHRHKQNEQ